MVRSGSQQGVYQFVDVSEISAMNGLKAPGGSTREARCRPKIGDFRDDERASLSRTTLLTAFRCLRHLPSSSRPPLSFPPRWLFNRAGGGWTGYLTSYIQVRGSLKVVLEERSEPPGRRWLEHLGWARRCYSWVSSLSHGQRFRQNIDMLSSHRDSSSPPFGSVIHIG